MGLGKQFNLWTQDDDDRMTALCTGRDLVGADRWEPIAEHFPGRSFLACRQRWLYLRNKLAGKPMTRAPKKRTTAARSHKEMVAAKRENRQQPLPEIRHMSLTAALCGDPLPGRSALDQRKT